MQVADSLGAQALAKTFLAEFETQSPITRKFLERLPSDKLTWKPHEKSLTAGQLAYHLAFVPGGAVRSAQKTVHEPPKFNFPQPASPEEILTAFDASIASVREILPTFDDRAMQETWRIVRDDQEILSWPRWQFLRDIMLNHWYQHRGQFCVYLRLLDVAVPSSWGPSADEDPFASKAKTA